MAPKSKKTEAATASAPVAPVAAPAALPKQSSQSASVKWDRVVYDVVAHYNKTTPQRTKLIDLFMVYLLVVAAIQLIYCVVVGDYPFNAFLSGFISAIGQFVLTASLRVQTNTTDKNEFPTISPERAFADYIFCSLILHFFVVNLVN
ncbi:related to apoptotic cell death regulator DAD1 [Cephalotrichum gorgonifer]|uniref:Dolichyl-diphosphooligosaccharide--protein glycosyltransferase subunit OST2 n=1 Tax=Cephalotrichum gorgonifer TaxID=2041049 RepID=A0AAE8MQY0_9PEZI|nr:related to apoptotic cell death regulator DAD1 [Cephalotrichum gorgonifer]